MNASHLRAQLRFPVPDKSSLAPTLAPALIPHALLVLRWIAAAALNSGMRVATHQSLSRMLREFGPLIDLLARAATMQQWRPGAAVDLGASLTVRHRPAMIRIAKALLPRTQERRSRPLGDILLEHAPSKAEERIEFLMSLAPRLIRYIQAVGEPPNPIRPHARRVRIANALHRAMLSYADEESLCSLYGILARGGASS